MCIKPLYNNEPSLVELNLLLVLEEKQIELQPRYKHIFEMIGKLLLPYSSYCHNCFNYTTVLDYLLHAYVNYKLLKLHVCK